MNFTAGNEALQNLKAYVCQSCGAKIGKARIKANPFSTLCVACQHEEEAAAARRNAPQSSAEYY